MAKGVLTQKHGDAHRPDAFYANKLPIVVQGIPSSLIYVASAAI